MHVHGEGNLNCRDLADLRDCRTSTIKMARSVALLLALVVGAECFTVATPVRTRAAGVSMMAGEKSNNTPAKYYPKGAFGGYEEVGVEGPGWLGDTSRGVQIQKFESGSDFLFFQGPAPKTAVQTDLPSFFSGDNFADMEIPTVGVAFVGLGLVSFAAVAAVVLDIV